MFPLFEDFYLQDPPLSLEFPWLVPSSLAVRQQVVAADKGLVLAEGLTHSCLHHDRTLVLEPEHEAPFLSLRVSQRHRHEMVMATMPRLRFDIVRVENSPV